MPLVSGTKTAQSHFLCHLYPALAETKPERRRIKVSTVQVVGKKVALPRGHVFMLLTSS